MSATIPYPPELTISTFYRLVSHPGIVYARTLYLAAPLTFTWVNAEAIMRASGNTRAPLCITGSMVLCNAILDPFLIFGIGPFPRLEVFGAALATVGSQAGGLVAMALILGRRGLLRARGRLHQAGVRTVLGIGVPAGLQAVTRPLTGMAMFAIVTSFGTAATAAFGIGRTRP